MKKSISLKMSIIFVFLCLSVCSFFTFINPKTNKTYAAISLGDALSALSVFNNHENYGDDYNNSIILPEEYCMRDEYMLYVENQASEGLCWDFASSMALSTTIMKSTNIYNNYSEAWISTSMAYMINHYSSILALGGYHVSEYFPGDGGDFNYFDISARLNGLLLEQDFPYEEGFYNALENNDDYYNYYSQYADKNMIKNLVPGDFHDYVGTENRDLTINSMKQHILNHGSIYAGMRWGEIKEYEINDKTYSYKIPSTKHSGGHAVSFIGWDDDYQVTVKNEDDEDVIYTGAWIALNSWGNNNDSQGIIYIMYDDVDFDGFNGYKYVENQDSLYLNLTDLNSNAEYYSEFKGAYYGDCIPDSAVTPTFQQNIFYKQQNLNLVYSYNKSLDTNIDKIEIFKDGTDVTKDFSIHYEFNNEISVLSDNADIGSYKIIITYSKNNITEQTFTTFVVNNGFEINYVYYYFSAENDVNVNGEYQIFNNFNYNENQIVVASDSNSGTFTTLIVFASYNKVQAISSYSPSYYTNIYSYGVSSGACWVDIHYNLSITNSYTIQMIDINNAVRCLEVVILHKENNLSELVTTVYNLNGGENNFRNLKRNIVDDVNPAIIYNPTKAGYSFDGWYYSSDFAEDKKLPFNGTNYYLELSKIFVTQTYKGWQKDHPNTFNRLAVSFLHAKWVDEQFTISSLVVGNGEISPSGDITVNYDSNQTYTFSADFGHHVDAIIIDGIPLLNQELEEAISSGYTFENVKKDYTIEVYFEANIWNLTYDLNYDSNSSVSQLSYGANILLNTPTREHYTFAGWFNETDCTTPFETEIMPNNDITIYAKWNINSYVITASAGENGTISPSGANSLDYLSSSGVYTFNSNYGYHISQIIVDGTELLDIEFEQAKENGFAFTNISSNHTIHVNFDKNVWKIIYDLNYDTLTETENIAFGNELTITKQPTREHYTFGGWYNEATCNTLFTSNIMPNEDIKIYAYWEPKSYEILSSSSTNGYIFPLGISTKIYLEQQVYTFTANLGYHVTDIKIDGVSLSNNQLDDAVKNGYRFEGINENHTIFVQFNINAYNLTFDFGIENKDNVSDTYEYADNIDYPQVPTREHYYFVGWFDSLTDVQFVNTKMPMKNITAYAKWVADSYTITVEETQNGNIYPSENVVKSYSENQLFTFSPNVGYLVLDIFVDGVKLVESQKQDAILNGYQFNNINENHSIKVSFAKKLININIEVGKGGTLKNEDIQSVEYGDSCNFEFDLDFNKTIDSVYVNDKKITTYGDNFKLQNITEDTEIVVTFKDETLLLTPKGITIMSIVAGCVLFGLFAIIISKLKRR